MKVNHLPDLVLRTIFSKVPLIDVVQTGRVCRLWRTYQQIITEKVDSITLLIGKDYSCYSSPLDMMNYCWFTIPHRDELLTENDLQMFPPQFGPESSHLFYSNFDLSSVCALAEALPNVNTLYIAITGIEPSVIDHLVRLLKLWSTKLVTLKIWCVFSEENEHFLYSQLFLLLEFINTLPILEHLTLNIKHKIFEVLKIKYFPNLSRLSEFFISTADLLKNSLDWLEEFMSGPATKLERIGFGNNDNWYFLLDYENSPVANKVTVLSFIDWTNYEEDIRDLFSRFNSLTSLHYEYFHHSDRSFVKFINNLAPLNKLVYLHLDFYSLNNFLSIYDKIPSKRIVQLSSVKVLSLNLSIYRNLDIESRHWEWIFPNVQVVDIKHYYKSNCDFPKNVNSDSTSQDQFIQSIRGLLHTFKQCPSLRRIYTDFPVQKKWDIKEI